MIVGKTFDAITGGNVAIARAPEGHRINQRFAQNDFFTGVQCLHVPHAGVRARQVQMQRCAGS